MSSAETNLREEITGLVAEIAERSPDEVAPDSTLEDLGIDSLDGLRIVAAVEKKYGIVIGENEIAKIRTMPDIFGLVAKHVPKAE